MRSPRVFVSAGEPSGDRYGAAFVAALRERVPGASFAGLGGPEMAAAGVRCLAGIDRLAVVGFVEVVRHLPFFWRLRARVVRELEAWRPDLVVAIDYPGFNLWLVRAARARGARILYYVAPQVWAWRWRRVRTLARCADVVAVVFPFEEPLLRNAGVRARFVGHPLVETAASWPEPEVARDRLGFPRDGPLLGLFPGSRPGEVRRLLRPFLAAAELLRRRYPGLALAVARPREMEPELYRGLDLPVVDDAAALLRASTAALVKSGTTTVEAALAGTPMVVAYRVHPLTYRIARRLVRVPHIAMVNLLAGRGIVPEFVQDAVRPDRMAEALAPLLDPDSEVRRSMLEALGGVRRALAGGEGSEEGTAGTPARGRTASQRVAELAGELLAAHVSARDAWARTST